MQSSSQLVTLTSDQVRGLIQGQPIIFPNMNQVHPSNSQIANPGQYHAPPNIANYHPPIKQHVNNNGQNVLESNHLSQQNPNNIQNLRTMYFENLICLWVTYEVLLLICLILQFLGCQSISAGNLWISIEVFLMVIGLANYGFWEFLKDQTQKNIAFGFQLFFFFLITILEIPAFALAVKYPTLIQYMAEAGQIGNCQIYSEMYSIDYGGEIKYGQPAQYVLLIIYLIQFFYSAYFTYQIGKKNWLVFKYLRNLPPQYQPPQSNQVMVLQNV